MPERTEPRQSCRDPWRQSEAAMTIAGELASLLFAKRLPAIDPQSRAELMEWAETLVRDVVEDVAPAETVKPHTSRLNTAEFAQLMEFAAMKAAETGYYMPMPDEWRGDNR